ncbi:terminase family protein [Orbus wheelerorum]|uniref:terminase large subunit domain-containing protein n=1 Tax=Orbus wheelerorum TaxID=3074111 RepID=UPI00370D50C0
MKYTSELRNAAKALYLQRHTPKEIAKSLRLPSARIVYYWAEKYNWALLLSEESVEDAINRRIVLLTGRENKSELELKELERLIDQHCKIMSKKLKASPLNTALTTAAGAVHNELNQESAAQHSNAKASKKKGKTKKNDISHLTKDDFNQVAGDLLYPHQLYVRDNKDISLRRFILKSRQIGFTFYFAYEAFEDAVLTGNNQIFVSASKAQAKIFEMYIKKIADQFFDIELKGDGKDKIILSNHAYLIFCANNVSTAQGYSGNLYFDEVFWMSKFQQLYDAASGMATQKYRETLFSTPSIKAHQAYAKWSGEEWKKDNPKRKNIVFPKDKDLEMNFTVCPDKWARLVITLQNAVDLGFDKVDIEDLRDSKSAQAFNMLYCCIFADSGKGVFDFDKLQKCITDSATWQDFDIKLKRPFGDREVWGGFDPSRTRDNATFVVIAPPIHEREKFRILEIYQWRGVNFKHMASEIKKIKDKYRMTYIGIDITGIGYGVYEHVKEFAPRETREIHYNVNIKNQLVLKMLDVVGDERIEWDESNNTLIASFLSIEQQTTAKSNQITYAASRSESTGHADEFFAISHAVFNEPLNTTKIRKSRWGFSK